MKNDGVKKHKNRFVYHITIAIIQIAFALLMATTAEDFGSKLISFLFLGYSILFFIGTYRLYTKTKEQMESERAFKAKREAELNEYRARAAEQLERQREWEEFLEERKKWEEEYEAKRRKWDEEDRKRGWKR